jgi:leader peptidase (prepilin peptidase)/N-methyltransferase
MLAALFLGGIFLILALLTKGFGLGDVKYIFAVSLLLGFQVALNGLLIGFLLGGVYSVYLLLIKKAKVNDTFAYGPFLVIGQVLSFIISLL